MNKHTIDFDKLSLGICVLTGKIYIYYPSKDNTVKYKKDITERFELLAKNLGYKIND